MEPIPFATPPPALMGPTEYHTIGNIYSQIWEGERPETVRAIADQWRTFGGQLRDTVSAGLSTLANSLVEWQSEGAKEAFMERAEHSAEKIAETGSVAYDVARALDNLAGVMDEAREEMKELWDEYQASRSVFYEGDIDEKIDMVRDLTESSGTYYIADLTVQGSFEAHWDGRARGLRDSFVELYMDPYIALNPWPAADTPYYSQTSRFPSWSPLEYVVHDAAVFGPEFALQPGFGGGAPVAPAPPPLSGGASPAFNNPSTQVPASVPPPPLSNLNPLVQAPGDPSGNQGNPVAPPPGTDPALQPPGGGETQVPPQVQPPSDVPGPPAAGGGGVAPPPPFVNPAMMSPGTIGPPSSSQSTAPSPPGGSGVVGPPGGLEQAPGLQGGAPPGMSFPPGTVLPPGWTNTLDSGAVPPGMGAPPGIGGPPGAGLRPPTPGGVPPPGGRMPPGAPGAGMPPQRRGQDRGRRNDPGAGGNPPGSGAMDGPPGAGLNGPGGGPPGTGLSGPRGGPPGSGLNGRPGGPPGTGMPPGRGGPPPGSRPDQRRDAGRGKADGDVPPGITDAEAFLPPGGFGPPVLGDPKRQQRSPRPGGMGEAVRDARTGDTAGIGGGIPPVLSNRHFTGPRLTRTQQREADREARRERVHRLRERLKSGITKDLPESTAPVLDGRDATRPVERAVGVPAALRGMSTPVATGPTRPQQAADRSARKLVTEQPASAAQSQAPTSTDQEAFEVNNPGGPVVSGDRKPAPKRRPTPGTRSSK